MSSKNRKTPFFTSDTVVPLYIQLKNALKKRLQENPDLERLPGTLELAQEYQVSKGTVTRALKLLVDENIICRIPHRGTLRCSAQDYADPQLNFRIFGLVFPAEGYSSWQDMILPMQKKAEFAGFSLEIYLYNNTPGNLQKVFRRARQHSAGIALYLSTEKEIPVEELLENAPPLVIIGQKFEGIPVSCISADNRTAAREITRTFLRCGLERVALIPGTTRDAAFIRTRISGWQDAYADAGLSADPQWIFSSSDKNFSSLPDFLQKHKPQAIILSNNENNWETIVDIVSQCRIPTPRYACFTLSSGKEKSCFTDDSLFAELPIAEIGEDAIRLLLLMLQKAVLAPQKHEIGISIYQKRDELTLKSRIFPCRT